MFSALEDRAPDYHDTWEAKLLIKEIKKIVKAFVVMNSFH